MASSTSKGPQAKTTEPMDSIKLTYCSIQLGWILARDGFATNYMGSRPEAKKWNFFILSTQVIVIFVDDFFNTVEGIEMKLKTYHYWKIKRWLVFITYRPINISSLFQNFFSFFLKMT